MQNRKITILSLATIAGLLLFAPTTNAAFIPSATDVMAQIVNSILSVASMMVTVAGAILNVSMIITLHIKDFVDNTPTIYTIWQTIRDITGIFFIFFLLYAAFQIFFDQTQRYKDLVVNIVIAGILVNFSFFFVSALIDASNIVSQTIYNQMLPNFQKVELSSATTLQSLTQTVTSGRTVVNASGVEVKQGGISDIFMNAFKIQDLYNTKSKGNAAAGIGPLKIIIIGAMGIVMMAMTSISFILAALAFIIRLIILLFILAFSPILVASYVIPQLKEYSGKIMGQLSNQLIFMPIYLLLMYAALSVLNNSKLFGVANVSALSGMDSSLSNWTFGYVVLGVNFAMVIIMLNIPLIAGLSLGGWATDKLKLNKWGAEAIWGKVGRWTTRGMSTAARGTAGRLANSVAESEYMKEAASHSFTNALVLKGLRSAGSSYSKNLSSKVDQKTKFAESLGYDKEKVKFHEMEIRDLREQQRSLRLAGDKAGANALNKRISDINNVIAQTKDERKMTYATNTKGTTKIGSLWSKVASSNNKAASKLQEEVLKRELERRTKALEKIREGLKEKKNKLENLNNKIMNSGGTPNPKQDASKIQLETEIDGLELKESDAIQKVSETEIEIENI